MMGTSNSYGGSGGTKPLIPSCLSDVGGAEVSPDTPADGGGGVPAAPVLPPVPPPGDARRFTSARSNFTRFASSGGQGRRSLGRALSQYVSSSSGGSRNAARRMGVSRQATSELARVLSAAAGGNSREALLSIGLEGFAGRPIEEIFLGIMEIVCPEGGAIDDAIARDAFVETIAELAENGITDFDTLTADQVQTILELNIAHAIEARICNDIGSNAVSIPANLADAANVQAQLFEFIERSVSDAFASNSTVTAMTQDQVSSTINGVYDQAFSILQSMAEAEVSKK